MLVQRTFQVPNHSALCLPVLEAVIRREAGLFRNLLGVDHFAVTARFTLHSPWRGLSRQSAFPAGRVRSRDSSHPRVGVGDAETADFSLASGALHTDAPAVVAFLAQNCTRGWFVVKL